MALKNVKSVGSAEVLVCLLTKLSSQVSHPINHIINLMMLRSIYPVNLKIALIKSIYKTGEESNMGNGQFLSCQ
ncbi:hypothetical protein HHI36_008891, partial [Cryptolaemus montrouzieri]